MASTFDSKLLQFAYKLGRKITKLPAQKTLWHNRFCSKNDLFFIIKGDNAHVVEYPVSLNRKMNFSSSLTRFVCGYEYGFAVIIG